MHENDAPRPGTPPPRFDAVAPALPCLAQAIRTDDDEALGDACWALCYLTDDAPPAIRDCSGPEDHPHQKIAAVLEAGALRQLVRLLDHAESAVLGPAVRVLGNIAAGTVEQKQRLLDGDPKPGGGPALDALQAAQRRLAFATTLLPGAVVEGSVVELLAVDDMVPAIAQAVVGEVGALAALGRLLGHGKTSIKRAACRALAGLSAGSAPQIQALLDSGAASQLWPQLPPAIAESASALQAAAAAAGPAAGGRARYEALFEEASRNVYNSSRDFEREAGACIANAVRGGSDGQIHRLVAEHPPGEHGAIRLQRAACWAPATTGTTSPSASPRSRPSTL